MTPPSPLVSATWLLEHLADPGVRVADCCFTLGQPDAGRARYEAGHLPGAVYLDLERDLSGPRGERGGRHPLPEPGALATRLGGLGIGDASFVVAYDDSGMYASRLWWLLRWLGHDGVAVLDGGVGAWIEAGGRLETAEAAHPPATFTPRPRPELVARAEDVRDRPSGTALVDSRAPVRYAGANEPIDPVAGHIPGAINHDWAEALAPDGRFKGAEAQRARFAGLEGEEAIVYCGSGVSACANLLALEVAGLPGARLYPGSWSDWVSDPENPVATGGER
jgi:thiosulfate/3-mercaptopyruvate sulfurtransferase